MFQLRVLGGLRLETPSGPIAGRAAQRRRLAVLARLALAHGTPLRRDLLCGLFWPEHSQERARQSLSAALYDLRQLLGDEALPATGDEVRLDRSRLWCDAVAFEDAVAGGRLEEAASLYCGPLLHGVFFGAQGSEEWQQWLDGERARLARLLVGALERQADAREAAGDAAGAVDVLLRLTREDPYGARSVLRLMNVLDRSGERAQAIQQARLYATRVRTELEAEPDPAVLELEQRLRREPPAAGGGAPPAQPPAAWPPPPGPEVVRRPGRVRWRWTALAAALAVLVGTGGYSLYRVRAARAKTAHPTIAVLPFENLSGDTENGYFVDGISDDLLTRLARVPRLRVISRISVTRYRGTTRPVRQIGRELGADYLLEGSIQRAGDRVRLNAQLIDAHRDRHVWAGRYDRDLRQIFQVQTEISEAIAAEMTARLVPGKNPPLATGGTDDPLAYDLYLRGQQWLERNRDSATRSFRQASALDPGFARPHAALARMYAQEAQRQGWRDSATAEARRALELDPRNTTARRALAGLYMTLRQFPDAERLLRQALAIDPNDTEAMTLLGMCAAALGRTRESVALRAATLRLDPLNADAYVHLALWLAGLGEHEVALRAARRAMQLGDLRGATMAAGLYMGRGDFAAARAVAAELGGQPPPADVFARGILAEAAARAGDWAEAQRLIDSGFGLVSFEPGIFAGYVALKLGQRARADTLLGAFERDLEHRQAAGFSVLRQRIRLAALRGDRAGAVALLRQAEPEEYRVCLPRRTLYLENLDGYAAYEAYRDQMCAEQARSRREMERSGALADLKRLVPAAGL